MIAVLLASVALLAVKTALLESVRVSGVLPDFFLALVFYASVFLGPSRALVTGAAVGFVCQLETTVSWGLLPAAYGGAGWLSAMGWRHVLRQSGLAELVFLSLLAFVANAVVLVSDLGLERPLAEAILILAIPNALATGLAAPVANAAVKRYVTPRLRGVMPRVPRRR
jgi:hypothetical protein